MLFGASLSKRMTASVPPFSIADIFPGTGLWYDISDPGTIFQDTSATTPATADGHPVRRINDKSGNGFHATYTSGTNPILKISGGKYWLEMATARFNIADLSLMQNMTYGTMMAAADADTATGEIPLFSFTINAGESNRIDLRYVNGVPRMGGRRLDADTFTSALWGSSVTTPVVLTGLANYGGGQWSIQVDNGTTVTGAMLSSGTSTNASSQSCLLFSNTAETQRFLGKFYGGVILPRDISANVADVKAALAALLP